MLNDDRKSKKATRRRRYLQSEPLLAQTKGLLRRFGLRVRKGLGQHFLIDDSVLGLIVSTAELASDDVVMEIGPGLGVLTQELSRQSGRVIAIELDDKLAAILKQTLASFGNVSIVNGDVLKLNPAVLLREHGSELKSYKVVANLPYYITSPVLRRFLEASLKPQTMVVMVQKEVAEEITARPGRMSLLSVSVQLYGEPVIIDYVPAASFYPAPEVDSAILKIALYPEPAVEIADIEGFFAVVRAGFTASRKQMGNSLAQGLGLPKAEALALLEKTGIASQRRAETLTLKEWARLWRVFAGAGESVC